MDIDRYSVHKCYVVVFEKKPKPQHSILICNYFYVSYNVLIEQLLFVYQEYLANKATLVPYQQDIFANRATFVALFDKILGKRRTIAHSVYDTSPSVSVASRRITLLQRPLRDLCSLVFGATRLKESTKNIILEISMLDYPIWSLESSESDYF